MEENNANITIYVYDRKEKTIVPCVTKGWANDLCVLFEYHNNIYVYDTAGQPIQYLTTPNVGENTKILTSGWWGALHNIYLSDMEMFNDFKKSFQDFIKNLSF